MGNGKVIKETTIKEKKAINNMIQPVTTKVTKEMTEEMKIYNNNKIVYCPKNTYKQVN